MAFPVAMNHEIDSTPKWIKRQGKVQQPSAFKRINSTGLKELMHLISWIPGKSRNVLENIAAAVNEFNKSSTLGDWSGRWISANRFKETPWCHQIRIVHIESSRILQNAVGWWVNWLMCRESFIPHHQRDDGAQRWAKVAKFLFDCPIPLNAKWRNFKRNEGRCGHVIQLVGKRPHFFFIVLI